MNFYEALCFAKVYGVVFGLSSPKSVSKHEVDVACEALKRMADSRRDWSDDQRQIYKLILDYAKQLTEGN